jgi:hypothetical protein
MAIAIRAVSSPATGTPGSTTVTGIEPTGTVTGDVVWAHWVTDTAAGTQSISLPSGWTTVAARTTGANFRVAFGYVVRGASAPSYAFTMTNLSSNYELYIWSLSGQDTAAVVDNAATPSEQGPSTTPADPPAATANSATDWALAVMADWSGSATGTQWGAPSGYTMLTEGPPVTAGAVAYKQLSATGSEDPPSFTGTTFGSDVKWTTTVTLTASPNANPSPPLRLVRNNLRFG